MNKLASALLTATALVMGLAGPASAATTGAQRFVIIDTGPEGTPGTAVLSGPVTGVGTSVDVGTDGTIALAGGTISVHHPQTSVNDVFNPATCILTIDEAGPYEITGGTGTFAGISGSGTDTVQGTVVFGRTPGGCSQAPIGTVVVVRASGTTTLP